ncbi:hypothetical protein GCM10012285_20990 [Streptomyces kronopolitis]|uniref:Uncharacterized protein n=1 Tax=Streptomyces kronopolitis TaxID=1612435 RepID=A0ABQ2JA46_9ACTN|nr:hypothetical protein GCM10012285_20990 [Streptomyces kronopolitis]
MSDARTTMKLPVHLSLPPAPPTPTENRDVCMAPAEQRAEAEDGDDLSRVAECTTQLRNHPHVRGGGRMNAAAVDTYHARVPDAEGWRGIPFRHPRDKEATAQDGGKHDGGPMPPGSSSGALPTRRRRHVGPGRPPPRPGRRTGRGGCPSGR